MPEPIELQSEVDIEAMLEASRVRPVVLLKHSATCPISARAYREFDRLNGPDDPARYLVVVQRTRAVSSALADRLGVRHESPQAHVLADGRSALHLNHYDVTADALREGARAAVPDA